MAVSNIDMAYGAFKPKEKTKGNPGLTMDGFMQLMAVQMQNQDMSSPMDNTQMMNQLTQMATVKAMNTFTDLASTQYAMSMIGQDVKLFTIDATGNKVYIYGKVAGIDLSGNKIYLENDKSGTSYGIGNIMEVGVVPKKEETDKDEKPGTGDTTTDTDKPADGSKPTENDKPTEETKPESPADKPTENDKPADSASDAKAKSLARNRLEAESLAARARVLGRSNNSEAVTDKVMPVYDHYSSGLEEKLAVSAKASQMSQGMIEKLGSRASNSFKATGPAAEIFAKSVNPSANI